MRLSLALLVFLALFETSQNYEERIAILLPPASGAIVYSEDEQGNKIRVLPERTGRFAELTIKPRINSNNPKGFYIPKDFISAVRELKLMLPPEYLVFVLERYGYVDSVQEGEKPRKFADDVDDSIVDLNYFLYNIWDLGNKDQNLARQMSCMGMFEFDMTALYVELVLQEILDNGGDYTRDMQEAVYLAGRLEVACLAE